MLRRLCVLPVAADAPLWSSIQRRSLLGQSFDIRELQVTSRSTDQTGSRWSRRLREDGQVPSVLYGPDASGKDESLLLSVSKAQLLREVNTTGPALENTLYRLVVDGEPLPQLVLPRQYEVEPAHEERPQRVNFLRYNPGVRPGAKLELPFRVINDDKCQGIKDGGWLMFLRYTLPVLAFSETIPNCVIVDLRGKRIGDKVRASEVFLNNGLLLRSKSKEDFAVAKIMGSKRLASAPTEEEE